MQSARGIRVVMIEEVSSFGGGAAWKEIGWIEATPCQLDDKV